LSNAVNIFDLKWIPIWGLVHKTVHLIRIYKVMS